MSQVAVQQTAPTPTNQTPLAVVTGAFGYTGRHIADRLLRRGIRVRTLTNHAPQDPGARGSIQVLPLDFSDPERLRAALRGSTCVYNTYWVRFKHGGSSHGLAVRNTKMLIDAAVAERVSRFVHVSIANPCGAPQLSYYRGKAELEDYLRGSGLRHSIVRPTVVYGDGDILINNIAWFLRHLPFFGIPGDGKYRIQPVFIEDYADLIVRAGDTEDVSLCIDAVGPDIYTFTELVEMMKSTIQSRSLVASIPPRLVWLATALLGRLVHDVVLTTLEIEGLMAGLLISRDKPTCPTSFGAWLSAHRDDIGRRYASELARRL